MTPAELCSEATRQLETLWALYAEAKKEQDATIWILDFAHTGEAIDSTLATARASLEWLGGEGLDRLRQGSLASLPFADLNAAWEAWKAAAISVGDSLVRIARTADKWSAGDTLARVTLDVGQQLHDAAGVVKAASDNLPLLAWAAIAIAAVLILGNIRALVGR